MSVHMWVKFISTVAAAALVIAALLFSYKYLRAAVKRFFLVRSIKKTCRKKKYKLEKLSSCWTSIFRPTYKSAFLITTPEGEYSVSFFSCLRYKDTYTFADARHYTTQSNAGTMLVNTKQLSTGMANKSEGMLMPQAHKPEKGDMKGFSVSGKETEDAASGAERILCINPVPIELRCVKGNTTVQMFDGDELDGYKVYSGKGLLEFLKK